MDDKIYFILGNYANLEAIGVKVNGIIVSVANDRCYGETTPSVYFPIDTGINVRFFLENLHVTQFGQIVLEASGSIGKDGLNRYIFIGSKIEYRNDGKIFRIGEAYLNYNTNGIITSIAAGKSTYDINSDCIKPNISTQFEHYDWRKPKCVGAKKFEYNGDLPVKIGGTSLEYNGKGCPTRIGKINFEYDRNGKITRIGSTEVKYNDKTGTVKSIGNITFDYYWNNLLKRVGVWNIDYWPGDSIDAIPQIRLIKKY